MFCLQLQEKLSRWDTETPPPAGDRPEHRDEDKKVKLPRVRKHLKKTTTTTTCNSTHFSDSSESSCWKEQMCKRG